MMCRSTAGSVQYRRPDRGAVLAPLSRGCARRRVDTTKESMMLYYALVFLIVGLVAGALGIVGVAAVASQIAYVLFVIGIVFLVIHIVSGRRNLTL
jgi:uncharacterized membrane protein YtjA (UPF0391 family)